MLSADRIWSDGTAGQVGLIKSFAFVVQQLDLDSDRNGHALILSVFTHLYKSFSLQTGKAQFRSAHGSGLL